MKQKKTLGRLIAVLALVGLQACANHPSKVDDHLGEALRHAVSAQTITPIASDSNERSMQMDGQAAKASIDRYQKSFETAPAAANVFSIGTNGNAK
jgi:hypothetical protein